LQQNTRELHKCDVTLKKPLNNGYEIKFEFLTNLHALRFDNLNIMGTFSW